MMNKRKHWISKVISCTLAAVMIFISAAPAVPAYATESAGVDLEWYNFRNNPENNGVTDRKTPITSEEAALKWSAIFGSSYSAAPTPPLLINGNIYIGMDNRVLELDKSTGDVLRMSDPLVAKVGYAMNPLIYADGKLFVQVGNGMIEAVDIHTMQTVWHTERIGGQTVSPISYVEVDGKGYVYTGTWNGESADGTFFCVSTDDNDVVDGVKKATWSFTPSEDDAMLVEAEAKNRGFYWAGAYATENYVAVGSDDGTKENSYTKNAVFYTLNPTTGEIIDRIEGVKGDIRTTAVYDNGYLYFSTKGGHLYKVAVDANGNLGEPSYIDLGGMTTASPVVYKNKIYIGVCGQGGQFDPDGGHGFAVVNNGDKTLSQDSLLYKIPIKGYPQASALVSTAYASEDFDQDGIADGRVYIYFTYNAHPGGIYYTYDTAEQTEAAEISKELYIPEEDKQQYCISTICADYDGTLYYKNDSCHLFAVEKNMAYLQDLTATTDDGSQISWNQEFDPALTEYSLTVPASAKTVTLEGTSSDGSTSIYYDEKEIVLEKGETIKTSVIVKNGGKSREYKLGIRQMGDDADLTELKVSRSNTYNASLLDLSPEFDQTKLEYKVDVTDYTDAFYRLWATETKNATIEVTGGDNVSKIVKGNSGTHIRYNVYPEDTTKTAVVEIKVTSEDESNSQTYRVSLMKKYYFSAAEAEVQEYDGTAVETGVKVYNGMGEIVDPSAYTVSYTNNNAVGTATATITGNEGTNYAGSEITVDFEIYAKELAEVKVSEQLYTGSAIEPEVTVISKSGKVVAPSVYDIVYTNNTEVGEASVTVTAKADSGYTGQLKTTFVIRKEKLNVTLKNGEVYAYTGAEIKPAITVKNETGTKTVSSKYYTVSYENNVETGTGTIHVKAISDSDYAGTTSVDFQILKGEISYYSVDDQAYTGKMVYPDIVIKDNNRKTVPASAYTMDIDNNVEVGTATFTVTAKEGSDYFGSLTGTFEINKARLTEASVETQTYTGDALTPTVTVTDDYGKIVPEDAYDVQYFNNTHAGNAMVILKAKKDSIYRGTLYTSFIIEHAILDDVELSENQFVYDGTEKEPAVSVFSNGVKMDHSQYTVKYTSNTNVGTAKVTVTGKNNCTGVTHGSFVIVPKATSKVTATLYGYDDIQVNWKKVSQADGYQVAYKKASATGYTYKYTTATSLKIANLSDGVKYTCRVTPYYRDEQGKKHYSTDASKSVSLYTLKKVTDVTASKYSASKVKVKWDGISGESGYQIYKMTKSGSTYKKVAAYTTTGKSKTISATKGKTYYYKVRAYKKATIDGKSKTIYGPWSAVKSYKL